MTFPQAAVLLFLVMDPVGNVPFFLSALARVPPERHRVVVARELVIALAVLLAFLFAGRHLLAMLHIGEPALGVAGGVILFLIALRMVFPPADRGTPELQGEPFIVPLAIPAVAGPSAMATVLLLMSGEPERWPTWMAAVVLAWAACGLILWFASGMRRHLSERGLIAMERLMGMLLVTIAVQMLMTGWAEFLATASP